VANNNEGRPIRLRPRRSKASPNDDPRRYVGALGSILRLAQMTKRQQAASKRGQSNSQSRWQSRYPRLYSQRVSVRLTYAKNKNSGQWKAHGHYIARESATKGSDPQRTGFDATRADVNIASVLDTWQRAGDERIFKIIVSPEFGERLNLKDHTRRLIARMETDLGTRLEWVAAAHFNTEHPHVHIALRGRDQSSSPLRIPRDYIRSGIRFHAENLATEALGFRTERDAEEAQRREITQNRFTAIDRIIQRSSDGQMPSFLVTTDVTDGGPSERKQILQQTLAARLTHLVRMGLAEPVAPQQWAVQTDFQSVLRTLQRTNDRQRMLATHGALLSDPRLPFEITNSRSFKKLEGRVLLHAEDEGTGRAYLLLEGTDEKIHLIDHTRSIEEARQAGKLSVDSFAAIEKRFEDRSPYLEITDFGDAHALLGDENHFRQAVRSLVRKGIAEVNTSWGGWLGQYNAVLQRHLQLARRYPDRTSERKSSPQRDHF